MGASVASVHLRGAVGIRAAVDVRSIGVRAIGISPAIGVTIAITVAICGGHLDAHLPIADLPRRAVPVELALRQAATVPTEQACLAVSVVGAGGARGMALLAIEARGDDDHCGEEDEPQSHLSMT